ncbi:hypothetical protein [Pedobacter westerhofensis]|nr:hypothetical protein [Pedobacter westerhofensis]
MEPHNYNLSPELHRSLIVVWFGQLHQNSTTTAPPEHHDVYPGALEV